MNTENLLRRLTEPRGISGKEGPVAELAEEYLKKYCGEVKRDRMGNLLGIRRGGGKLRIMLEAHMDQVGLIVTEIEDSGSLKFAAVGGVDARILPGLRVKIFGSETITGVIAVDDEAPEKTPEIKNMKIYAGFESKKEAEKLVKVGDFIAFDYETERLLCGNLCSGALDNRAGMAAMLSVLEKLDGKDIGADIYTLFSTQEEVGLRGSYTGAFSIKPDIALVVDVTHGTTVDSEKDPGVFDLGCGPVILRGPSVDYDLSLELIEIAKENDIPYKIEAAGGASGTTAWAIQTAGEGVRTVLISIPLRYMHTNVEVVKTADVEAVAELAAAAVEKFAKDGECE